MNHQQDLLDALFQNMAEGVVLHDLVYDEAGVPVNYRFRRVNPAFERLTGLPAAAAVGRLATEFHGLAAAPYLAEFAHVVESGQRFDIEIASNALARHFHVTCLPLEPGSFLTIFQDTTERRKSNDALRESEERLRVVFETSPVGIAVVNVEDLRFVAANPGLQNLLGYSEEELFNLTPQEITHPDDWFREVETMRRHMAGETALFHFEKRFIRKDGEIRHTRLTGRVLRFGPDAPPIAIGNVIDITEMKRAEEALRQSEQSYRGLIERLPEGTLVYRDGIILFANAEAVRITGVADLHSLIGRRVLHFIHPDSQRLMQERDEALTEGRSVERRELKAIRENGAVIYVEVSSVPVIYQGQPAIHALFRDITAQREMALQLQQAQKMESVGRLAGGVAHDFNNLLTVINGYSQMLLRSIDRSMPMRETIEEIHHAGERAAALTRQLLAFSRRQVLQPRVIDIGNLLRGLLGMLRRLLGEDVELQVHGLPRPLWVNADPHQMEQVLMNLVVNARDAMGQGGRLEIESSSVEWDQESARAHAGAKPGRYARIAVHDTGTGMDEATLAQIFEPFFTTKDTGKGTGLGLPMVQGIVAQSGGFIDVSSRPGEGTSFLVYLPEVSIACTGQLLSSPARETPRGHEAILVVEDEAEVREYVSVALRGLGYRVYPAAGAAEALSIMEREAGRMDLVLTDVVMPQVSGRQLVDRLSMLYPGLKVLYMSGYADDVVLGYGVPGPGTALMEKPFTVEQLALRLREVLGPSARVRILVADREAPVRRIMRLILERAGYEIVEAAEARQILPLAAKHLVSIVLLDLDLAPHASAELCATLRHGVPGVRILGVSSDCSGENLPAANSLRLDGVLAKPVGAKELTERIAGLLATRP